MTRDTSVRWTRRLRLRLSTVLGFAIGAASFAAYALTAARSVWWGDSAELVAVARTLGVAHPPGYPLYTLLSAVAVRLPIGTPFFRLSLFSAAAGAAAAGVVAMLAWELCGQLAPTFRRPPVAARGLGAVAAGSGFALTPSLWSQSTVPEVYSLSSFLVLSVFLLLMVWRRSGRPRTAGGPWPPPGPGILGERALPLLGLMLGLAVAHHLTALLAVPSVVVGLSWHDRRRPSAGVIAAAAGLLAFGVTLYAYLPLRSAQDPAVLWARVDSWSALLAHVSAARYASRLLAGPLSLALLELRRFVIGLPSELAWPLLVAAGIGIVLVWRGSRTLFVILMLEIVLVVGHAVNYRIPDIDTYYIPAYGLLSAFAGVGIGNLAGWGRLKGAGRRTLIAALALVIAVPLALRVHARWPERDLSDRRGAADFAEELLESAGRGLVLAQNDRTVFLLWHARFVEGKRPDLAIIDVRGRAPHFERWFPEVRFPTERELARHFGRSDDHPCDPLAREAFPVAAYAELLVALNQDSLAVYADVDLAASVFPRRSLPSGLLAEITPKTVPRIPRDLVRAAIGVGDRARLGAQSDFDPRTAQAYAKVVGDFGELFLARGDTEDAVSALERSRDLAPEIPQTHSNLGVAYLEAGRIEDGVREIAAALALEPGLASAHYSLYRLLLSMNELQRAAGELEAAIRFDRRNVRYWLELASLRERVGRHGDADRIYRRLEESNPQNSAVRLAYGDFLARRRRYPDAIAAYRRADELNPGSPGILCNLGRCYWELADAERAIEAMRRSAELQPHNPRLKYSLAEMLHCAGRSSEAIGHLDDVIRVLPDMWEARALKATIFGERGRYAEARRLFEEARALGADDPSFWAAWSAMESAAGETLRARELAQRFE